MNVTLRLIQRFVLLVVTRFVMIAWKVTLVTKLNLNNWRQPPMNIKPLLDQLTAADIKARLSNEWEDEEQLFGLIREHLPTILSVLSRVEAADLIVRGEKSAIERLAEVTAERDAALAKIASLEQAMSIVNKYQELKERLR